MSNAYLPPLKVGDSSTNTQESGDLGKSYSLQGNGYIFAKINSLAVSAAGGKIMVRTYLLGVPTGQVAECTALNSYDVAGVIPLAGAITSTTALAAGTYLLLQRTGPAIALLNSTIVTPAVFGSTTTSGVGASIDSTVYAPGAILGRATNTVAATLAGGQPMTCILTLSDQ